MGEKIRVVVDTNILIAALGWDGNSRELVKLIINGNFSLFITKKQIAELITVMGYPKFKFSHNQKENFLDIIYKIAKVIQPKRKISVIKEDSSDNMFLECAYECGADFIITGDKHLLELKKFNKTKIFKVKDFLDYEHEK